MAPQAAGESLPMELYRDRLEKTLISNHVTYAPVVSFRPRQVRLIIRVAKTMGLVGTRKARRNSRIGADVSMMATYTVASYGCHRRRGSIGHGRAQSCRAHARVARRHASTLHTRLSVRPWPVPAGTASAWQAAVGRQCRGLARTHAWRRPLFLPGDEMVIQQ